MRFRLALAASGLVCALPVAAQDWYAGADRARARLGEAPAHWVGEPGQAQPRDNGVALAAGYRFGERWAVELGVRRLGQVQWTGQPPGGCPVGMICPAVMPPPEVYRLRGALAQASLLAHQPLGGGLALRGRAGMAWLQLRAQTLVERREVDGTGAGGVALVALDRHREHRVAPWLGLGLRYALGPRWAVVGELQSAIGPRATRPTLLSLGGEFGF